MAKFVHSMHVQPQDRCRQTALFLWWFNPGISILVILVLFYCFFPPLLTAAHHSLQSQLREIIGGKKQNPADESAKTSTTRPEKDTKAILTTNESESEDAHQDASSSDADAVIVDPPSSNSHRTDAVSALQREDNVDTTSSTSASKTAPDHVRQLSHIFVQHTLLTFVIQPFLIFLGCLFVNNANFCDWRGNSRYPSGLWNMLWVLLPGYLLWGWSVVAAWGETASAVMGWHDREKPADMSYLQVVLMFVVLPVPMVLILLVVFVYSGLVELVAKGIERRDRSAAGTQKVEGRTGDAVEGDKKNL